MRQAVVENRITPPIRALRPKRCLFNVRARLLKWGAMGKLSRKSLRRFVKLWLQVQTPSAAHHQTLTLPRPEFDLVPAKCQLGKLLDNIHHQFPLVGSLYVAGQQASGSIHFHVIFLFFSPASKRELNRFGTVVWRAWNDLNGRKCSRTANRIGDANFSDRIKIIGYVLKDAPVQEHRGWGLRNVSLIQRHSRAVERAEIDSTLDRLSFGRKRCRKPRRGAATPIQVHTINDVRRLREWCDADPTKDWETFKRQETGRSGKVSDRAYLEWWNGNIALVPLK